MDKHNPLLDLAELQDLYEAPELRKLLTQVRQHLAADAAAIAQQAADGSYDVCHSTTHRLKSMVMFVTGERLRTDFERLEQALQQQPTVIDAALGQLHEQLDRFDAELAASLAQLD